MPVDGELSFDDLLQRIHPAESRIRKLAASSTRRVYIVFDLLVDDAATALVEHPLAERREAARGVRGEALRRTRIASGSRPRRPTCSRRSSGSAPARQRRSTASSPSGSTATTAPATATAC